MEKGLGVFSFYIYRTFRTKKTPKNAEVFNCKIRDFECSMKSEYDKYLSIAKHKIEHLERKKRQKTPNTHANAEKGGRDFFGSIYIEHLERKKCQKMPKGFNVK